MELCTTSHLVINTIVKPAIWRRFYSKAIRLGCQICIEKRGRGRIVVKKRNEFAADFFLISYFSTHPNAQNTYTAGYNVCR